MSALTTPSLPLTAEQLDQLEVLVRSVKDATTSVKQGAAYDELYGWLSLAKVSSLIAQARTAAQPSGISGELASTTGASAGTDLLDALRRLCTQEKRTSGRVYADWDNARAVLARYDAAPQSPAASVSAPQSLAEKVDGRLLGSSNRDHARAFDIEGQQATASRGEPSDAECDEAIANALFQRALDLKLLVSEISTDTTGHREWGRALIRSGFELACASHGVQAGDELPPLPRKLGVVYPGNYWTSSDQACPPGTGIVEIYTADQMLAYAHAALANRASSAPSSTRLPNFPKELYEFYPTMSAETHKHHVQEYARAAVSTRASSASADIQSDAADPMRSHFTCEARVNNDCGVTSTLYFTKMGAHGTYQLYRNEVEALYLNIGAVLGIPYPAATPASAQPADPYALDDDDEVRFPNDTGVAIIHAERYWELREIEKAASAQPVEAAPAGLTFHGYSDTDEHQGETILDLVRSRLESNPDDLAEGNVFDVTAIWVQDQQWRVVRAGNPMEVERVSPPAAAPAAPVAPDDDAKDAARYRYLRDTETLPTMIWEPLDGYGSTDEDGNLDREGYRAGFDQAIDAAMSSSQQENA